MNWLEDAYTLTAGDVAGADCGRAWNWGTNRWETVSAVASPMSRSIIAKYRLRAVLLRVYNAAGAGLRGRLFQLYVVGDPLATTRLIRLQGGEDLVGGSQHCAWMGDFPMCAGFQWLLAQGGGIAGDVVVAKVGYQ